MPNFSSVPDYSEILLQNSGRIKIAREVTNKHMKESLQTYAKDHNKQTVLHPYEEGDRSLILYSLFWGTY
jgi:hypothetical protein